MRKFIEGNQKVSQKKVSEIVNNETLSKSKKMKALFDLGYSIKEISTLLNVRYNFVYNVISNYVNLENIQVVKEVNKQSKKDLIIEMFKQGKTRKEISIELKTNYNYVFNVIKEYTSKQANNE
jgi:predicted transcriptional regulator